MCAFYEASDNRKPNTFNRMWGGHFLQSLIWTEPQTSWPQLGHDRFVQIAYLQTSTWKQIRTETEWIIGTFTKRLSNKSERLHVCLLGLCPHTYNYIFLFLFVITVSIYKYVTWHKMANMHYSTYIYIYIIGLYSFRIWTKVWDTWPRENQLRCRAV